MIVNLRHYLWTVIYNGGFTRHVLVGSKWIVVKLLICQVVDEELFWWYLKFLELLPASVLEMLAISSVLIHII
jgi:hypothetical protein